MANPTPYTSYRDSGVPWLGGLPEHWDTMPLKHWVRMNGEVLPESTDAGYELRYVDIAAVGTGNLTKTPQLLRFGDAPSRARRVVRKDDTIVSTVRTYLKAVLFVSGDAGNLICSTGFAVLTPRIGTVPKYVSYLVQSRPFTNRVTAESVGIAYPAIPETRLGSFRVAVPPLAEQVAIVRFLDHVDRRIRRGIAAKKKLVALLNEQRQVTIQEAVTRGLDPGIRVRPSGVKWLGNIPAHWEVVRAKRLFSPRKELALPGDVQLSSTQAYGVIPQVEFEERVGRRVVQISMHLEQRRHVEKDDFVISMRSFQGGLERAWAPGAIRSSYVVLRPEPNADVGFFSYLFKSRGYIQALQATANFIRDGQDLNFGNFCEVDLPLVPVDEQKAIARTLSKMTATSDTARARAELEIKLLHEYRDCLIADLTTGRLDVREAASQLPDEIHEADLLDLAPILAEDESEDEAGSDGAVDEGVA